MLAPPFNVKLMHRAQAHGGRAAGRQALEVGISLLSIAFFGIVAKVKFRPEVYIAQASWHGP